MDASVKRGAECNTDHQLLCMTLMLKTKGYSNPVPIANRRHYDVSNLACLEVRRTEENETKTVFVKQVLEKAREGWRDEGNVQEKWSVVCSTLTESSR